MLGRSAFSTMRLTRVVALPGAIDALADRHAARLCIRVAPDEILFDTNAVEVGVVDDAHAIVAVDDSYSVAVVSAEDGLARALEWEFPTTSSVGQGLLHNVAVRLVRHRNLLLLFCPTAFVHELEERLA